jgi:hypothetical protein
MAETFETYTRRPLIYKIMQMPAVLLLIFFAMAPFSKNLNGLLLFIMILSFFLGSIGYFVNLFWSSMPSYIKDGELVFEEDRVVLNNTVFILDDLKLIEIDCYNYAGKPGRSRNDGTYNKITISKKNGESIEHRFVISSGKKKHNLGVIMKQWKQGGFKIISNGIDLI